MGVILERAANINKLVSYKCNVNGCEKVCEEGLYIILARISEGHDKH
jgi:hypothetical protein